MIDDLMISLSKLTDPARSRQFENASIYNMMAKAKALLSPTTSSQVDALICELKQHVHNIREHRNKSLAHADLDHALKLSALPPVTYDELEKAMTTVKEIITKVASEACRWTPQYNIIIPFGADAESLLKVLKRGHCIAVES